VVCFSFRAGAKRDIGVRFSVIAISPGLILAIRHCANVIRRGDESITSRDTAHGRMRRGYWARELLTCLVSESHSFRGLTEMRKIIGICAAASAAVLLTFAVAVATVEVASQKLEVEGHQYADAAIRAVATRWDRNALMARASAQLRESPESAKDVSNEFSGFRVLGRLTKYHGCIGSTSFIARPNGEALVMAEYTARAEFQNGPAEVRITLLRSGDSWKILRFAVSPIITLDSRKLNHTA
jgi:hypothetical protein